MSISIRAILLIVPSVQGGLYICGGYTGSGMFACMDGDDLRYLHRADCRVCNNDLPQSNHDFCTKAAWPRPSQFWGIVTTMWGTNSECRIAANGETPVLCAILIYHSPITTSAQIATQVMFFGEGGRQVGGNEKTNKSETADRAHYSVPTLDGGSLVVLCCRHFPLRWLL